VLGLAEFALRYDCLVLPTRVDRLGGALPRQLFSRARCRTLGRSPGGSPLGDDRGQPLPRAVDSRAGPANGSGSIAAGQSH